MLRAYDNFGTCSSAHKRGGGEGRRTAYFLRLPNLAALNTVVLPLC